MTAEHTSSSLATESSHVDVAFCPRFHKAIELIGRRWTGAVIRVGGGEAFYHPGLDYVQVPPLQAYFEPINWFRTVFHELGHHTGHASRLNRDQSGVFGSSAYAREELVALS